VDKLTRASERACERADALRELNHWIAFAAMVSIQVSITVVGITLAMHVSRNN